MDDSDQALIRRCRGGDQDAFGVLVKRYAGRAVGAAFALLGNHADALDASQEAFLRSWRGLRRFRGDAGFYAWYAAILRNVCASLRRRRARDDPAGLRPAPPAEADPALLAEGNERARRLWQAVLDLSVKHREVIVMSHFQEMSYKQMAGALDVPIGTVMSRLHHARQTLRAKLAGDPP